MITVEIEVVPYPEEDERPYRAGMAVVKINGKVHSQLRTSESFTIQIPDPDFTTWGTR